MTPIDALHPFTFKINDIDPERRVLNLFGKFSPLCATGNPFPEVPQVPGRFSLPVPVK